MITFLSPYNLGGSPSGPMVRILPVGSSGELMAAPGASNKFGVRPVINLKSDIEMTSGNGTVSNPYVIKTS